MHLANFLWMLHQFYKCIACNLKDFNGICFFFGGVIERNYCRIDLKMFIWHLPNTEQVDKIPGGARLGFITVGDGQTEVLVYIDCLVFPATSSSGPIFRAIRNGPLKDKPPPGEPRIMRSLLQALQKSVEIARVWTSFVVKV